MTAQAKTNRIVVMVVLQLVLLIAGNKTYAGFFSSSQQRQAKKILNATGVKGGLIVHVGCGDGKLTAALRANESYIVQGLDSSEKNIEQARKYIQKLGIYGAVSIDKLQGNRLPYIDNLVNIVVSEDLGDIPRSEVMRILCPDGVAYIRQGNKWKKLIKQRPEDIDDWTHYLHDPQGTMVGRDRIVGPPRRLQWVGGPKWLRNHDFMSSLNGMVSSNGRIFYLIDEGLRNHIYLPARWSVVARDAFNGTDLWKRSIEQWFPHTWPFKSGPGHLPRRIVAVEDRVYVTLGITAPLSELDAVTGKTIRTYNKTKATEEIVLDRGVLYLVVDPDKEPILYKHETSNRGKERNRANVAFGWSKQSPAKLVMAVSADTGKEIWRHRNRIAPLTLAVRDQQVFFHDGEHIVALNSKNGNEEWISEGAGDWAVPATGYAPRLIAGDGVVVLSTKKSRGGRLVGVSAETGKILWKAEQPSSGHFSPEDLYLINGVVWTAHTGKIQTEGTHFVGIDIKTGRTRHDFVAENLKVFFMHQRCYPGRATERYIMTSGTGTEFLELGTEQCELHHWLRGSCIYGIMPCNGLIYRPPESCACYYQSKLAHFCAIAPASEGLRDDTSRKGRLEKGPAYGDVKSEAGKSKSNSWPTYRHDPERSGHTDDTLPAEVRRLWKVDIGGKLSAMTAADGKLFVSAIDRHTVYALDNDSGKKIWSYTTSGRVDSPPTIYNGRAIFGCADGWVYCLRASDGALVWRYRAAPGADKLVSYQQVESVWPLHGSVLVYDGTVYCLAGRNMFVDGGMHLVRLDALTGKLLSETVLDDKDPRTGKNLQTLMAGKAVPVTNPDIFSCDGDYVYMRSQKFDLKGERVDIDIEVGKQNIQSGEGRHLFCPTGFLDDSWFHRSFWIYGKNAGEGHGEYTGPIGKTQTGRLIVFDKSRIYSFFAHNVGNNINPRTYYSLYASNKEIPPPKRAVVEKVDRRGRKSQVKVLQTKMQQLWELAKPDLLANAMVLAGDKLFMAGSPDVADEEKTYDYVFGADDDINRQMRRQEQAWRGKKGVLLWVVSADTGTKLSEYKIPAIPVWDGMIAAEGRLYLSLKDGTVLCMGKRQ
ncbi:MAG: PQQ-binding-like beta-propeller repeat protein [Planctomycetes bacterium]|nr:PQQ-binding-like beta-propeller repeat protein [Planctomycetota bacterium]